MDSKPDQVSINNPLESISNAQTLIHDSSSKTLICDSTTEPSQSPSSEISSLTQGLEANSCEIAPKSEINSIKTETLISETLDLDCKTPTELIFDPFRPGPEELAFAPKRKTFRRKLNYDISFFPISNLNSEFEDLANEDNKSIEEFCKSFIDQIITKVVDQVCNEGFDTPKNKEGFLNGFADTCPPAPLRPDLKKRGSKVGLCRNLELEFDLV